ncbi:MAG: tetratricopeptide repeat protein, partial [Candidatus Poribacteria bacterium]|nr:tetratricopeptide repeat protein [Candidatus Poribacteria bacterium]
MSISKNKKLVPSIAEQLILELFAGQTKELQEIKTKVAEVHKQRGGLPHTAQYHPVERALDNLKRDGKAEKPPLVYWKIHATKEQTITENTIKTLDEFIAWTNRFDEGEYVFRGVPNKAYKIQASAYRRPEKNERNFEKFLNINKDLIRAARQRGYDRKDGKEWSDLEILVELQHYGAATCLIDFSYSAQIALWFACRHFQKKDENSELQNINKPPHGKVSIMQMKRSKFTEITPDFMKGDVEKTIDYFLKEPKGSPLYYLKPMFQNNRIIAQQSVLLFGNYELEADDECFIEDGCKKKILTELERTTGYTEDRLFPDFEGFAWVNREDATYTEPTYSELIDFGESAIETEEQEGVEKALEYSSRAIQNDPNRIQAYNLRGRAYTSLERYDRALEDFAEAETKDPDEAETYFNRGYLYQQQGLYADAINDYDTAISKKEDYREAYYRRGRSKYDLGEVEEALTDFTEAIRLKPDYFDAYFQRALALLLLQPVDARQDLEVALELAKQQKNEEWVAEISSLIQDIFGHNTSE